MARRFDNVSNDRFVAYVERFEEIAIVTVHPRPANDRYGVDFSTTVSSYETLSRGAMASARREIRKLARQEVEAALASRFPEPLKLAA